MKPIRLGIVSSHPIQNQVPLYRALSKQENLHVEVLFLSRAGADPYLDPEFGERVKWDVPLLAGYQSEFVPQCGPRNVQGGLFHRVNPGLFSLIRGRRYDVLLVNGWFSASYLLAIVSGFFVGTKVLLRGESNGLREPRGIKGWVKRTVLRFMFGRCYKILSIGTLNRSFYTSLFVPEERLRHVPYSVDNNYFKSALQDCAPELPALRRRYKIDDGTVVFLFCGKLIAKKRPMDVLRAFAGLPNRTQCRLIFVGSGECANELEDEVNSRGLRDSVHFAGFKNQSEVCRYYSLADVFVIASDFEPWGLVVNEAMCFGLPIIATTSVGATADLVQDGENGFRYLAGDIDRLSQHMLKLSTDSALRERQGARSSFLIDNWGIEQGVEGLQSALAGVVADGQPVGL